MEGLQLIDLGNEVSYIDIDTSKVPYKFSVKLDDRTFTFCIRYNEQGGFFTADLSVASTGRCLSMGILSAMAGRSSTRSRTSASRCRSSSPVPYGG